MTCRTFCGDRRCTERCIDLSVTDQRSGPLAAHCWPKDVAVPPRELPRRGN